MVQGSGFRGSGFWVLGSGFRGSGFKVLGFRVQRHRVQGSGVQRLGEVPGSGFNVQRSGLKNSQTDHISKGGFLYRVYKAVSINRVCLYSGFYQYSDQRPSVVTFEPLAQTWHVKMLLWKPNSIKCESNVIDISRRARAGLNSEPGTDQFRL
jgi:hypothetical protein